MRGPLVRLIKEIINDINLARVPVTSDMVMGEVMMSDQEVRHAFFHNINPNVTEFDHPASAEERMESRLAAMLFVVESMTIN